MKKLLYIFNKFKKDLLLFMIPFSIFSILLLTYYPGLIPYDGNNQWQQVQDNIITNAHPFFSTYFMLMLSRIWNSPTIVLLFQMFIFSIFWSYMCHETRNDKNFKIQIVYTIIVSFLPIIGLFAITLWKDILYSYYLMMLGFLTYKIGKKQNFKIKISQMIGIGILLVLVFSYRHNGMIVASLYLVFISFLYFRHNKGNCKKILIMYLVFILLIGLIAIPKNYYLKKSSKLDETSSKTINTVDRYMIWILGEYLKSNTISEKDLKILNNIMEIDDWKETYSGYLINPTFLPYRINDKYVIKNETQIRELFMEYLLKRPDILVKHYFKSNCLLINPVCTEIGYVYYLQFDSWDYYNFNKSTVSKTGIFENFYTKIINISMKLPIRLLHNPALILFCLLFVIIVLSKKFKKKNIYLLAIPMFLNVISLFPINLAQDLRYVYINYLTVIVYGLIYFENRRLKQDIKIIVNKIKRK